MEKTGKFAAALFLPVAFLCSFAGFHVRAQAASDDYYAPLTEHAGEALLGQVHDLITTTHTHYTSYDDSKKYGPTTDPALGGESGVVEFYTHETIAEWTLNGSDAGRWNREHVWAQSLSREGGSSTGRQLWGKEGGGADLHHLRPSEVKMNATRGNNKYGEVTNGTPVYSKKVDGSDSMIGGYNGNGTFEPLENVKGDVARIVLYVYTHYNTYSNVHGTTNGSGNSSYFGTLPITNIVSASSEAAAFDLLMEWNASDPVDAIETTRNEEVFKLQHNRNPFIDHPELVSAIWGDGEYRPAGSETPDPDPTPSTPSEDPKPNTPETPSEDPKPNTPETPSEDPKPTAPNTPSTGSTPPKTLSKEKKALVIGLSVGGAAVAAAAVVLGILLWRRRK